MKSSQHTRRSFIRLAGSGLALGLASCDEASRKAFLGPLGGQSVSIDGFQSPTGDAVDLVSHTLSRLTWGCGPGDYQKLRAMGTTEEAALEAYLKEQLDPPMMRAESGKSDGLVAAFFAPSSPPNLDKSEAGRRVRALEALHQSIGELYEYHPRRLNFELTQAAFIRAVYSPWQLYEVMVGFWTDHFNIDSSKEDCRWLKTWDDREVIRRHALGKFSDLLRASALSPAMLYYLDGRQNRRRDSKDKPNENYARELMELHTLGVHGGYTQQDVFEVARCLTGWTVGGRDNRKFGIGQVEFKPKEHDDGAKTVMGTEIPAGGGEKDMDKVLDLVSNHPSTAKFVATKLCRRFIADDPPDAAVTATAEAFTKSSGDIKATLGALFATSEFRSSRGTKFKRPFHFIASALRAVGASSRCGIQVQQTLRRMGQMPFDYPTPEGYSDRHGDWLSTLMARWDFALRLTRNKLDDSAVDLKMLTDAAGGEGPLRAHFLGRQPSDEEREICASTLEDRVALLLTSPVFQKY